MNPVRSLARDFVASPLDLGGATSNGMKEHIVKILIIIVVSVLSLVVWMVWRVDTEIAFPRMENTPAPTLSPRATPTTSGKLQSVPFTAQAPFGNWSDPRQQDGCEEASVIMAMRWVRGQSLTAQQAEQEIFAMSAWAEEKFGTYHDISVDDTMKYVTEYYGYANVHVERDIIIEDIVVALDQENVVIVPANGRWLENPNFTAPGPEYHMLLVKGYDPVTREFVTNDPGTRNGNSYRYSYETLYGAIREYSTGHHLPVPVIKKSMIVVSK